MSDETVVTDLPVDIKEDWCKGCNICVALCPKEVLKLIQAKAKVVNPDACIFCRLCELRCPDFAITVNMELKDKKGGSK
jgi:2-oxoglutarate ferredoxin oxidoreductase subunit delta